MYEDLKKYKTKFKAKHTKKSITIDVNNFMYMLDVREKSKGINMFDVNDYFISTDNNLCKWASMLMPEATPLVVLPSVWHTLILKYSGRANDDYYAYNAFMKLRLKEEGTTKFDEKKLEILKKVQDLPNPSEIRTLVLRDIREKLEAKNLDLRDSEEIIKESSECVMAEFKNEIIKDSKPDIEKHVEKEIMYKIASGKVKKRKKFMNMLKRILGGIILVSVIVIILALISYIYLHIRKIVGINNDEITKYSFWILTISTLWAAVSFVIKKAINLIHNTISDEEKIEKEIDKLKKISDLEHR